MDTTDPMAALTERPDGVAIALQATPGAQEDRFPDGFDPWRKRIGVRTTAPPENGKANRAIAGLVADFFGVPPRAVGIMAGQTGTQKTVHVSGVFREDAVARLAAVLDTA